MKKWQRVPILQQAVFDSARQLAITRHLSRMVTEFATSVPAIEACFQKRRNYQTGEAREIRTER
jgi:hypothetical protein